MGKKALTLLMVAASWVAVATAHQAPKAVPLYQQFLSPATPLEILDWGSSIGDWGLTGC